MRFKKGLLFALVGIFLTVGALPAGAAATLAAPASVKATAQSTSSILVTWGAVAGASGYEVSFSTSKTGTYNLAGTSAKTSLTKTGLAAGTSYSFKVRAYTLSGKAKSYGQFSAIATVQTKAAATTVAADYKNVVFYGDFFQLSPEGFSGNNGPIFNVTDGGAMRQAKYIWQETMNPNDTDTSAVPKLSAYQKVNPRYFRVKLTKDQKLGAKADANFRAAVTAGQSPIVNFMYTSLPVGIKSLPKTTTKVFLTTFNESYFDTKQIKKDSKKLVTRYMADVKKMAMTVKSQVPKAQIYLSSLLLFTKSHPRMDVPEVMQAWGDNFGGMMASTVAFHDVAYRRLVNSSIAQLCKDNGWIFINLESSGLTDSEGFMLEKYVHPFSTGAHYNQAGLTLLGDYICKSMGLKTAAQMYAGWK